MKSPTDRRCLGQSAIRYDFIRMAGRFRADDGEAGTGYLQRDRCVTLGSLALRVRSSTLNVRIRAIVASGDLVVPSPLFVFV
jgi:hypothetical protein